jgi:hypothetical protein
MQKRVFSVGSFFDTFLAVQKSMPNANNIAIHHSLPYTTTKAQAIPFGLKKSMLKRILIHRKKIKPLAVFIIFT